MNGHNPRHLRTVAAQWLGDLPSSHPSSPIQHGERRSADDLAQLQTPSRPQRIQLGRPRVARASALGRAWYRRLEFNRPLSGHKHHYPDRADKLGLIRAKKSPLSILLALSALVAAAQVGANAMPGCSTRRGAKQFSPVAQLSLSLPARRFRCYNQSDESTGHEIAGPTLAWLVSLWAIVCDRGFLGRPAGRDERHCAQRRWGSDPYCSCSLFRNCSASEAAGALEMHCPNPSPTRPTLDLQGIRFLPSRRTSRHSFASASTSDLALF
jgi:hypothetical protein